jgi:uncharacterized protein
VSTSPSTDAPSSRHRSIDALRGVAILGTLASNIWIFSTRHTGSADRVAHVLDRTGLDPTHYAPWSHWHAWDGALALAVDALCNGKFLALLSILFGVGMCAQFEAARRQGLRWPWRYYWRVALLLLDGVFHHLFVVEFDILMGYAVTAFVVAPLLALRGRAFALATAAFALVHSAAEARRSVAAIRTGGASLFDDDVTLELMAATSHRYTAQVAARWEHFWTYRTEALVIAPPLSATLFLIGAALWRRGLFNDGDRSRPLRRRLAIAGLSLGGPLTLLPTLEVLPPSVNLVLLGLQRYTVAPILALGYLGAGLLLLEKAKDAPAVARLAEIGRASLSCYMLQNVLCSVLFYHWGFGLAPMNSTRTMLVACALGAALTLFAYAWFRRFRQGPFEAVWKRLSDAPFRA